MSIKNDGQLHSKTELEVLRIENDGLMKVLGEATLDIKVLKKAGDGSTTKPAVESLFREFGLSMNRIIKILGIAKSSIYYQPRPYPLGKIIVKNNFHTVKTDIRSISCKSIPTEYLVFALF